LRDHDVHAAALEFGLSVALGDCIAKGVRVAIVCRRHERLGIGDHVRAHGFALPDERRDIGEPRGGGVDLGADGQIG
jgi:hypothetical protein